MALAAFEDEELMDTELVDDDSDFDDDFDDDFDTDYDEDDESESDYDDDIDEDYEEGEEDEEYLDNSKRPEFDFINDQGEIVVQDNSSEESEDGFELKYIDIEKIAITNRIRKLEASESLVKSIRSTGLLEPVVVAETATYGLYVLIAGFRRLQACARAGKTRIPCIVNKKVNTTEIPILEAVYNQNKRYSIDEQVKYIDYLEKQKGIMNPSMIEYLLQMDNGDYTKLKDLINDGDTDILTRLMSGEYTIGEAFKRLEKRRRKESRDEKENKLAEDVYSDSEGSGVDQIEGSGEEASGVGLTDEQISQLAISAQDIDEKVDSADLGQMVDEDSKLEGFEPHRQSVGEREYIDPTVRKAVMVKCNGTCQCCNKGGSYFADILDYHHIIPVFLGGVDSPENGTMLCVACHRLVHLYSTGDLVVDEALKKAEYNKLNDKEKQTYQSKDIYDDEVKRIKRVVYYGGIIRKGISQRGMNREQYKKEHPNTGIGRRRPGVNAEQTRA